MSGYNPPADVTTVTFWSEPHPGHPSVHPSIHPSVHAWVFGDRERLQRWTTHKHLVYSSSSVHHRTFHPLLILPSVPPSIHPLWTLVLTGAIKTSPKQPARVVMDYLGLNVASDPPELSNR